MRNKISGKLEEGGEIETNRYNGKIKRNEGLNQRRSLKTLSAEGRAVQKVLLLLHCLPQVDFSV